jgi:hypothetical protein
LLPVAFALSLLSTIGLALSNVAFDERNDRRRVGTIGEQDIELGAGEAHSAASIRCCFFSAYLARP